MNTGGERVLVTGANGFVGKALCELLVDHGFFIRSAVRSNDSMQNNGADFTVVGDIDCNIEWAQALEDVDCVVHLAARVHVMNETASNPLEAFRLVNTAGTEKLARDAAKAGVKRLVYLSTIKVNGEETYDVPFNESAGLPPTDPYGLSKWEAEVSLQQISAETGLEVVIIRPPLVYGPGVKGNFLTLLKLVSKGVPLPLALVNNKRSLVSLGNLTDLIRVCIVSPHAAGEIFLASDGRDLSTTDLIELIASGMGKRSRLVPVPLSLLYFGALVTGRRSVAKRLLGSLQVDASHVNKVLNWTPPYGVEVEMNKVVDWYLEQGSRKSL